jgi:hypothetical protein
MSRTIKRPYTKSKRFDKSCRCHGGCGYCEGNRLFGTYRAIEHTNKDLKEVKEEGTQV